MLILKKCKYIVIYLVLRVLCNKILTLILKVDL